MIGDRAKLEKMGASVKTKGFHALAYVRLDEELLDTHLTSATDPTPKLERMRCQISYKPRTDRPKYMGRNYVVVCSETLKGFDSRYRDWEDFCGRAERDPVVAFVKKWSPISEKYFEMAKANTGVEITFSIDWVAYHEHLEKKYEERYGTKPPPGTRLLSYNVEGVASAETAEAYQNTIYQESIKRKLSKSKGAKKKA